MRCYEEQAATIGVSAIRACFKASLPSHLSPPPPPPPPPPPVAGSRRRARPSPGTRRSGLGGASRGQAVHDTGLRDVARRPAWRPRVSQFVRTSLSRNGPVRMVGLSCSECAVPPGACEGSPTLQLLQCLAWQACWVLSRWACLVF